MTDLIGLTERLSEKQNLNDEELKTLISSPAAGEILAPAADRVRRRIYGDEVYARGLIEFTNICKNDCFYCGIRASNAAAKRYRLTKEEILACCKEGYALGFRTFVLQGGEDPFFTDEILCDIIAAIREKYPDCAITLSVGEKEEETYRAYFAAGANRYLLRHETASAPHYAKLHPQKMSLENRKKCLFSLKEIGFQVGSGFMVGSPYQTDENLVEDLRFLQTLSPDMIGIGPYIPHRQTPFAGRQAGSVDKTLRLISILRLMFPHALIPATTALGTLDKDGREKGLQAGANVVMPNLSPVSVRKLYDLYENKICTGEEAAQCRNCLARRIEKAGYRMVIAVGNVKR